MMVQLLKNKVVVITGGAQGIGYAIATQFLENGIKTVILLDFNEDKGIQAVKTLNENYGKNKAVFIKCDVVEDLADVSKRIFEEFKQVDVLINSAGVGDETRARRLMLINSVATIEWSLAFWEHMRTDNGGKGGTIINIVSIFGFQVCPIVPVYTASKFATYGFTKAIGHKSNFDKSGVRVIGICPGVTKTGIVGVPWCYPEAHAAIAEMEIQEVDTVGKAAVEVFEKAASGSMWMIRGAKPIVEV